MLNALKIGTKSATIVRISPPSLPSQEQIHGDIAMADDDDVVFTLMATTTEQQQQSDTDGTQNCGSDVVGAAGDTDVDSSVGPSIYHKVEAFVEQVMRMTNSHSKLMEDSERLEGLISELADSVKAVRRQTEDL